MKYDVDKYLEGREIKRTDLDKDIKPMLTIYDKIIALHKQREKTGEHLAQANKIGKDLIAEIKAKHPESKSTKKAAAKKEPASNDKKGQEVIDKTPAVVDELSECRRLIKVERQEKIKSGAIKAPVKQTRYTKIKNSLVRILKSIPGQNVSVINSTKEALAESAKKIFKAHGWKQWQLIDELLGKVAAKRISKLEPEKE